MLVFWILLLSCSLFHPARKIENKKKRFQVSSKGLLLNLLNDNSEPEIFFFLAILVLFLSRLENRKKIISKTAMTRDEIVNSLFWHGSKYVEWFIFMEIPKNKAQFEKSRNFLYDNSFYKFLDFYEFSLNQISWHYRRIHAI